MPARFRPVLALAAAALVGLAGRTAASDVERTLDELPPRIGTDTRLVVVSDAPGWVRWGVNGWTLPAPGLRAAGTAVVDAGAVETPLDGPAIDGRFRARLGPFPSGVASLELVLRHADGTWTSRGGRDARVRVAPATWTRRRPITIGPGPALGRSGGTLYHEDLLDWEYLDCRGVDAPDDARAFGDGRDAARDLCALYSRREADRLYLRADLLDLGPGDERGALELVVLVDCASGGQTWLPDYAQGRAGAGWELAVTVRDAAHGGLMDAAWRDVPGHLGASFHADLDAVELGVELSALRAAGWDGTRSLRFAAYTLRDGDARLADAFAEPGPNGGLDDARLDAWTPEDRLSGTAKYASILHGNQAVQPLAWLRELVGSSRTLTPAGNRTGYHRALDAHELFRAPVSIHVSGTLAATLQWGEPAFNARLRGFLDDRPENGQGALLGGVLAEHVMPFFENAASHQGGPGLNARSIAHNDALLDRLYGGPARSVLWLPERVARGSTLRDVLHDAQGRPTGYTCTVVDQVTHLARWFGAQDALGPNGHKPNRIHGVTCFAINDAADQWKFANTDGGLWLWTRRDLLRKALDPDQEQLTLVFDDWEASSGRSFTSFGRGNDNPDNYERNVRWLASHPWIQVVTLDEVASWGWREVERGAPDLPLETYDWLRHASEGSYAAWYDGSAQEEAFSALHAERTPGAFVPRPFGAVDRPGTLLHEVWSRVARAPRGALRDLAEAVFMVDVFETAWHDEDMDRYLDKTAAGDYAFPDLTHDRLAGWARSLHARVGDAALVAAAARWSAAPPAGTRAWTEDVDEDGEAELVLADERAFYALEDDGGRLVFAAVRDPATGRAQPFVCGLLLSRGDEPCREREAEADGAPLRPHGLVDWWATAGGSRYVNDAYRAEPLAQGWRLRSSDGAVEKRVTLDHGRLAAAYTVAAGTLYVRTGLAPATLELFRGARPAATRRPDGALVVATPLPGGGRVSVALACQGGARRNEQAAFAGDGAMGTPFAYQVEVVGQGSFVVTLEPRLE